MFLELSGHTKVNNWEKGTELTSSIHIFQIQTFRLTFQYIAIQCFFVFASVKLATVGSYSPVSHKKKNIPQLLYSNMYLSWLWELHDHMIKINLMLILCSAKWGEIFNLAHISQIKFTEPKPVEEALTHTSWRDMMHKALVPAKWLLGIR